MPKRRAPTPPVMATSYDDASLYVNVKPSNHRRCGTPPTPVSAVSPLTPRSQVGNRKQSGPKGSVAQRVEKHNLCLPEEWERPKSSSEARKWAPIAHGQLNGAANARRIHLGVTEGEGAPQIERCRSPIAKRPRFVSPASRKIPGQAVQQQIRQQCSKQLRRENSIRDRTNSYSAGSARVTAPSSRGISGRQSPLVLFAPKPLSDSLSNPTLNQHRTLVTSQPISDVRGHSSGPITVQPQRLTSVSNVPPAVSPKPKRAERPCAGAAAAAFTKRTSAGAPKRNTESDVIRLQPVILDIEFGKIVLGPGVKQAAVVRPPIAKEQPRVIERPRMRESSRMASTEAMLEQQQKTDGESSRSKPTGSCRGRKLIIREKRPSNGEEEGGCCRDCIKDCANDLPEHVIDIFCCG